MITNRKSISVVVGAFLLLGLFAIAGANRATRDDRPVATDAAPSNAAVVTEAAASAGAKLVGVAKFAGPRPVRRPIVMFANKGGSRDECIKLHKKPTLSENLIVSEKGELANVFVYIRKGLAKKEYPLPKKPAVLDQQQCMFRPRVQGIRVGQELIMRNGDKLTHNVRSYAFRNRPFNIAQPADSEDRKKVFKRPERAVQMGCDIHKWMTAYVFAMDHPFFAVSDEKGRFEIKHLPAGEYTIAAWHEELGEQRAEITVGAGGSLETSFTFKAKKSN